MSVRHAVFAKELEKIKSLVIQVNIFLLGENLLAAVPLLIEVFFLITSCGRAVEHVYHRNLSEVDECNVVHHSAGVLVDNKNLLVHIWEELPFAIRPCIF